MEDEIARVIWTHPDKKRCIGLASCNNSMQLIHENRAGVLYWVNDTYLYHRHHHASHLQEDVGAEFLVAVAELSNVKVPLIVDRIYSYSVDEELTQLVSKFAPLYFTAIAFVSHNAKTRWANNYSRDRYSSKIPVKIFDDSHSVIKWTKVNQFDCGKIPTGY
ncbi:MAG: hypothetical protein ACI89U_000334 [Gammaproteobacteria bacterium]|jgi:hypothetical protein